MPISCILIDGREIADNSPLLEVFIDLVVVDSDADRGIIGIGDCYAKCLFEGKTRGVRSLDADTVGGFCFKIEADGRLELVLRNGEECIIRGTFAVDELITDAGKFNYITSGTCRVVPVEATLPVPDDGIVLRSSCVVRFTTTPSVEGFRPSVLTRKRLSINPLPCPLLFLIGGTNKHTLFESGEFLDQFPLSLACDDGQMSTKSFRAFLG